MVEVTSLSRKGNFVNELLCGACTRAAPSERAPMRDCATRTKCTRDRPGRFSTDVFCSPLFSLPFEQVELPARERAPLFDSKSRLIKLCFWPLKREEEVKVCACHSGIWNLLLVAAPVSRKLMEALVSSLPIARCGGTRALINTASSLFGGRQMAHNKSICCYIERDSDVELLHDDGSICKECPCRF